MMASSARPPRRPCRVAVRVSEQDGVADAAHGPHDAYLGYVVIGGTREQRRAIRISRADATYTASGLATGSPAARQAWKPPSRSVAAVKPSCCSVAAARLDWYPSLQTRITWASRPGARGSRWPLAGSSRHSRTLREITSAPGM